MKYLKFFEDNNDILYHKNDIIISEWHKTDEIYLILNDVYKSDKEFTGIYVGCISKYSEPYYNISLNMEAVYIKNISHVEWYKHLNDTEKDMMCNVLYDNDKNTEKYINIIKDICGVDLRDLPELMNYNIKMSAGKFNL